jgi:hypothetical protein
VRTQTYSTPAPAYFAVPRAHVSMWVEPVQGIGMSVPAIQFRGISLTSGTCAASANAATNAAKGATRKDATGGGAFEDPV